MLTPSCVRPCRSSSAFTAAGGDIIGKLQFDRREARRRGCAKSLEQRTVGEQMAEIGGKAGHSADFLPNFHCLQRLARIGRPQQSRGGGGALIQTISNRANLAL